MPQLIIEQPGESTLTFILSEGETCMGRAEDNQVILVADEVSRHHAKIVRRGDKFLVLDLRSLNGTYVNRQRVVERVLSDADEIWLGSRCRIVFRDDPTGSQEDGSAEGDPGLIQDLNRIRAEMEQVGEGLTIIAKEAGQPSAAEAPPQEAPSDLEAMSHAYRRLDALYRASKILASEPDLKTRLAAVLDTAIDVMGAERGFVMLREEASGELRVGLAREMGHELEASAPSMGIAGRAAIDGEPVLMQDAGTDAEFGSRDSIILQRIVGAMCVPLQVEHRILGSIYVDTRKTDRSFNAKDLELFAAMAAQSAMAIENVRFYEQMLEAEKRRANLGRFLSPAVVEAVMQQGAELALGGEKRFVTTLFADIRGFTTMSERVTPTALVELLNEHFTAMTEIVFENEGTLDKYNGDEVMALFGAPLGTEDDLWRACQAALQMQAANRELNVKRKASGQPTFEIGIGIAAGEVIAGYIGSPKRMDFTVVGDRVNTARRLCSLAKPGQTIVCHIVYEGVKDRVEATSVGAVALKGKEEAVTAYEVLGLRL